MWSKTYTDWKETTDEVSKKYQQMLYKEAYENAIKVPYKIVKEKNEKLLLTSV